MKHKALSRLNTKTSIISPLRSILNKSWRDAKKKKVECECILLKNGKRKERFKLFKEKDMPMFTQEVVKMSLRDFGYDNDAQTDDEQIARTNKLMQSYIRKSIKKYQNERKNTKFTTKALKFN